MFFRLSVCFTLWIRKRKKNQGKKAPLNSWKTFTRQNICFVVFFQLTGPSNAHSFTEIFHRLVRQEYFTYPFST